MNADGQAAASLNFQSDLLSDRLEESDLAAGTISANRAGETPSFNKVFFERPSETLD
jgi:hypothetical protein